MTTSRITACVLLLSLCILAGCGGSQITTTASNPTPTPSPATPPSTTPPPPGTPPPSFPTEFVYTADVGTVTGFKINSDGSLSTVSGSPFANPGGAFLVNSGNFLVGHLALFSVNSSGSIQLQDTHSLLLMDLIPDPAPAVHGNESLPLHFPPMDTFGFPNGKFTFIQEFNNFPGGWFQVLAVDPTGKFIYGADRSAVGDPSGPYDVSIVSRNSDGTPGATVAFTTRRLCPDMGNATAMTGTVKGNHTILYHSCLSTSQLAYTVVDNTNGTVLNFGAFTVPGVPDFTSGRAVSMAVDPAGTSLVMINAAANGVDLYALDPNTGVPSSQPVARFALGVPMHSVIVDATGQYVYAVGSSCTFGSTCTDKGHVFAFKLAGGNLSPLPASPFTAGTGSGTITLVKF